MSQSRFLAADVSQAGATIRLDEHHLVAELITWTWNCASRVFKLLAGSFIFCEAKAFRQIGGFSHELFAAEELELAQTAEKNWRVKPGKTDHHPAPASARDFCAEDEALHGRVNISGSLRARFSISAAH